MNEDVHYLFHEIYGYANFGYKEFIIFVEDIEHGKYDYWFKSHGLEININHKYIEYIGNKYAKLRDSLF